jgi:protein-L-isoaspartate(D-aspartate) O-methyltransferase
MFEEDSYKHKGLRLALAESLFAKGIRKGDVLKAIETVPRHYFLDSAFLVHAYEDKPFPIGEGQTISQPYTVAFQTELLDLLPGMRVLEVGTGSGYQACILAALGAEVFTVELRKSLSEKAKKICKLLFPNHIKCFFGDGSKGHSDFAPFDAILVTAGAPFVPEVLFAQLKIGGRMVIPVGDFDSQNMLRITKTENGQAFTENFGNFRFVPLIGENAWQSEVNKT